MMPNTNNDQKILLHSSSNGLKKKIIYSLLMGGIAFFSVWLFVVSASWGSGYNIHRLALLILLLPYSLINLLKVIKIEQQSVIFTKEGLHLIVNNQNVTIPWNEIKDLTYSTLSIPYDFPMNSMKQVYPGVLITLENKNKYKFQNKTDGQYALISTNNNLPRPLTPEYDIFIKMPDKGLNKEIDLGKEYDSIKDDFLNNFNVNVKKLF